MSHREPDPFRVIAISPLERPDPGLVAAVCRAGAFGVLDLGREPERAARALAALRATARRFGVRVPAGAAIPALPAEVTLAIVDDAARVDHVRAPGRRVLVHVPSLAAARAALAAGATGVIARGSEAGAGGDESTFVLLQRLVAELDAPVWAQGGIGRHTAAACVAGGAAGVVLDVQLALVRESTLPADVRAQIAAIDGGERQLRLPVGPDAAFAKPLAQELATAGRVVRAVRAAIDDHIATAARIEPLAPGAPLAAAHGLRYPIAQGPMSRVSDRAGFAAAVADAGGLPFLALSLMSGDEVRTLVRKTRALVGNRPWGVGILGFVPPELREQQLAVLAELPPPIALIAGGRPSQAAPLEARGIATYLHVPSPGLLDMFLADGARRFVFEGSECGGHIGPRTSFVLWETQVTRLLAHPSPAELSVLFAGGIHDARSAAMVAALAAPLAERGAKVGVLMGTAYLFTHEAVAAGAIEPAFQHAAVACDRTVLLETSPGHATRCADTEYAREFAREKQRLEAAGVGTKDMWAELEQLNLGRLRVAAKGLRRDGDRVESVDVATQEREGMYMIGQVAALRGATCSIAELHHDVAEGSRALIAAAAPRPAEANGKVAIIGLAAMFPGAPDTGAYWRNIVNGANSIREVPPERWNVETYYDPAGGSGKTPCKWGGFLDDIAFDPLAYGIPPKSLAAIEPVQLLSLEIAARALADAGYAQRAFDRSRTAVIFGAEAGTDLSAAYSFRALFPHYVGPLPEPLDGALPVLSEDSFPGVLANVIAGRIANRLDLGGVNYTVDAACAASLAALDMAVKELLAGASDMVLCGGADLHNSINDYLMFASVHALSPTGQCHTFDANADGIVLGEGVACVVLKRLADAERDGDRIYAVIEGVAGASDGKSLGLTAPRKDGQVRALERAYADAGVSPAQVGLVEAHGTGTIVGDRTELATLTEVYTSAGAAPGSCVLGSVKSQIGHTKCAAGMAGLIKAALAIHHGVLPPTSNIVSPNPAWDAASSPFAFLDRARPWLADERVAAVSAFGFGGTNFHAVLASHRGEPAHAHDAWSAELLAIRGADRASALAVVERIERALAGSPRLCDVARTACTLGEGPVQLAIVATDLADLRAKLAAVREGRADRDVVVAEGAVTGKLAFLCPGQGSQKPGMLGELFVALPRLRRWLELGAKWRDRLLPPAAFTRDVRAAQADALTDTRVAQPALGIVELAVADLLVSLGVVPDMVAGHSYGELTALCLAGALAPDELLALAEARGEAIVAAAGSDPGAMAAVAADAGVVAPLVAACEGVVIANHNSPKQCVVSGPTAGIERALAELAAAGLSARRLPVACAFHSAIVAGARDALASRLAATPIAAPQIAVWSNLTAAPYPEDPDGVRELLAAQVAEPVRFADEVLAMYAAGARIFVETGPGQVLTKLVDEILGARPHVAIACDAGDAGLRQTLRAIGALAVAGVALDPAALFWERDAAVLDLDALARRPAPAWLVNGHIARAAAAPYPVAAPVAAMTLAAAPAPAASQPAASERDGAVLEYLRTMRSMIAAQRDVMLAYLGAPPAAVIVEVPAVHTPARVIDVPVAPAPVAPPAPAPAPADPLQLVLGIVSERTGYPIETLGLDLDLEADLSIDSIKRIEIIGELANRLGLRVGKGAGTDAMVEELAVRKTLRALVEWLSAHVARAAGAPSAPAAPVAEPAPSPPERPTAPIGRYRLERVAVPMPVNGRSTFAGHRFAICDGGPLATALAARLAAEGAEVRLIANGEPIGSLDGFVDLAAPEGTAAIRSLFERVRDAALGGAKRILVASPPGCRGGAAGLVKTLCAEFPALAARAVELDSDGDAAARLHAELHAHDDHAEIIYADGERWTRAAVLAPVGSGGELPLDRDSVVLITGGARGITARVAIELAQRYRCRIELVGRSPLPGAEDPALADARDARALRSRLAIGGAAPAEIEARCARILADREIRATLAALGDRATYHAIDVRTPAFGELIDELYRRHGRLDAAIHGAGVLEDKLIRHKTSESFERVYATKVAGAATLAERLRADVKLVVLFSSIAGAFGNRGQADYAAAGDALDRLAWSLQRRIAGRVVSIDWGPWAGGGMVSAELEREYARRGIGLIDPADGIAALLAELRCSQRDSQVILTASDPRRGHADAA